MSKLEELRQRIRGPVFSVLTPFREDTDEIDFVALEKYLNLVYNSGGRIFYVMAYNSRFSELSWNEIKILNTFVTKVVKSLGDDTIVIVADPLHCSTAVSIEFCRHAEAIGADIISLIFREKHYSNAQVVNHYRMCADASNIGILIHEMPLINGHNGQVMNWPIELLDEICDIENIIAIKEDAKDDNYSHEVISTIKDRVNIIISGGGKKQWLTFAELGCQAWLNGIGVFDPRLAVQFYKAYQSSNEKKWKAIVDDIEVPFFENVVHKYSWHLGIKSVLESQGIMSRHERMPMLALDKDTHKKIADFIKSLPIEEILDQ